VTLSVVTISLRSAAPAEFVTHSAVKPQVTALQAGVSGDIA
jgi:hypothetical protein